MTSQDLTPLQKAAATIGRLKAQVKELEVRENEPIAVVGLACRAPQAANAEALWTLLHEGRDAITEVPPERWDINQYFDPRPGVPGKSCTREGGFLDDISGFDAEFFKISAREAEGMDPQQRILLECAWHCFESAGIRPSSLRGEACGVFVGVTATDYGMLQAQADASKEVNPYFNTGTPQNVCAGRISYLFGLEGPSLAVDTACSSSLTAIHLACQSLRANDCSMALAGGVNLTLTPLLYSTLSAAGMLSVDGRCKPFDVQANGYARGEGVGLLALKRLGDAIRDKDPIIGLIRGSSLNQDGGSSGLTVPNGMAQKRLIEETLKRSGLSPEAIDYVEAHGTGTALGDPIEVRALGRALAGSKHRKTPLPIGSIKSNIGHLESAAGVFSVIKVLLALHHEVIPATLHITERSKEIAWDELNVRPLDTPQPWPRDDQRTRIAGVSGFGASGSNAHLLVEEAPATTFERVDSLEQNPGERAAILLLSAEDPTALKNLAKSYIPKVIGNDSIRLHQIAAGSQRQRDSLTYRAAIVAPDAAGAIDQLSRLGDDKRLSLGIGPHQSNSERRVAFIYSGQGDISDAMGSHLYRSYGVYRSAVNECAERLEQDFGKKLVSALSSSSEPIVGTTTLGQTALFTLQYALTRLWESLGVHPHAVAGHSIGEFAAAVSAGALTLESALQIVICRAQLMESLEEPGGMLAVNASPEMLHRMLAELAIPSLSLAVRNGPTRLVAAGPINAIDALSCVAKREGIRTTRLTVTHGFHSPLMDPLLDKLRHQIGEQVASEPCKVPYYSSLLGSRLPEDDRLNAAYWARHCRETVRFSDVINSMTEAGINTFIELGPAATVTSLIKELASDSFAIASQRPLQETSFENSLAESWVNGLSIDWHAFPSGASPQSELLPLYPFTHKSYWIRGLSQTHAIQESEITVMSNDVPKKAQVESILFTLTDIFSSLLRTSAEAIDPDAQLIEMGADSLILVSGVNSIQNEFGLKLEIQQLFEELTSLRAVAAYIASHAASAVSAPPLDATLPAETGSPNGLSSPPTSEPLNPHFSGADSTALAQIIVAQTQLMAKHLELLHGQPEPRQASAGNSLANGATPQAVQPPMKGGQEVQVGNSDRSSPLRALNQPLNIPSNLGPQQQAHMDALIARYLKKTPESKRLAQACRQQLADSRASVGFRFSTKEVLYPITGVDATGSHITDVDGNDYIDITMGFGVLLFGNNPTHMAGILEEELRHGFQLGPRSAVMQEVAELFCDLTGKERVAFTNSGTEAVMTALRLARAATKRDKIAIFEGAYHGHSDGTLAKRIKNEAGEWGSEPVSPGIPSNVARDCLVLEYGKVSELDVIRNHAHELGAVLVEPVQSRNLELQPIEFLKELRKVTHDLDIPLVFDEMITGFRVHPRGIQGLWGIEADLAAYGKVLGGGTPIGAVAGAARFMDGIDGGMWNYGDDSYPRAQRTYFGGTFCQHPLSMAGCLATLRELKQQGPALQESLSNRTRLFATRVNDFLAEENVDIQIIFFGSIFTFRGSGNLEVFFYHLLEKGIYIWEWRACFLSTAHTDEDLESIFRAIRETISEMQDGGFFTKPVSGTDAKPTRILRSTRSSGTKFSLYFFGNYDAEYTNGKYDLLMDAAKHGDTNGYEAIWLPERHFDRFGGFSPNPSVLAAAISRETANLQIRGGSVVTPLHHPLRIAEEWALVDNLSEGRTGIAFASGWHPNDFALAPENFENNKEVTFKNIDVIRRLWRGETVPFSSGTGKSVELGIFPQPKQRVLPGWLTVVANPETYEKAAELGLGILTNLLGQSMKELEENLALFKAAWIRNGRDPAEMKIAVLMHTYLEADAAAAIERSREPLSQYLLSSMQLFQKMADALPEHLRDIDKASESDKAFIINKAFERYVDERALIGSPESCAPRIDRLLHMGVTEIGCFLDFGIDAKLVLQGLHSIDRLRDHFADAPVEHHQTSSAQQQLWALAALDQGGNAAYMDPAVIEWRGSLEPKILKKVFHHLIERHDALRSNITDRGNTLVIHPRSKATVEQLSFLEKDDPESAARDWLAQEISKGADMSEGCLFRPVILELEQNRFLVALLAHHIVSDGPSMGIIIEEMVKCYQSVLATGKLPNLPPTQSFSRFIEDQRRARLSEGMRKHAEYWKKVLLPLPPALDLPIDGKRDTVRSWNGRRLVRSHGQGLASEIEQSAVRMNATTYMFLHAVFAALLHRWTGQEDLIIGAASSGRSHVREPVVGYGVHLLPVRSQGIGGLSQKEFVQATCKALLHAYSHQEYPFAWLFEDLDIPRDPARAPLVNVIFNYERLPESYRLGDAQIFPANAPVTHSRVDLVVTVNHIGSTLELIADYNSDLFEDESIARLLRSFENLLHVFCSSEDKPVSQLSLLAESDYEEAVIDWNRADKPHAFEALPALFRTVARECPNLPAVRVMGNPSLDLSFAQLEARANYLAERLQDFGIGPRKRVGILLGTGPDQITALMACLLLGCPYVPMDSRYPLEHLRYLIDDANISVLITASDLTDLDGVRGREVFNISDLGETPELVREPATPLIFPDDIAYVIYTSGSTGRPKGIEVTHRGLSNYLRWASSTYAADQGAGAPILCSLGFDAAVPSIYAPLICGKPTVLIPTENETQALQRLANSDEQFSFLKMTPAHLEILNRLRGLQTDPNPKLAKYLVLGGEALAAVHVNPWLMAQDSSVIAINEYGPTEATVGCCVYAAAEVSQGNVPIGLPIQGTQLFVLDDNFDPVLPGMVGELFIGGSGLAQGYLGRPALTAEAFIPNPFIVEDGGAGARLYRTGDLARRLPSGDLEFLGRIDSQLKINGYRVEPAEIEAVLVEHDEVEQAAVMERRSTNGNGNGLTGFVQLAPQSPLAGSALRQWLATRLPPHLVPSVITVLDSLPLTTHGKIDRNALSAIQPPESEVLPIDHTLPKTKVQEQITEVWKTVLNREAINGSDNFFDLGGTSLHIIDVHNQLIDILPQGSEVIELFRYPTISSLSAFIESGDRAKSTEGRSRRRAAKQLAARRRVIH